MIVEGWDNKQLRELSDIRVSNVDKKFYASEKPIKLCNYMDVYANEYVTDRIQFMEASATPAEIERFSLKSGDVIITKDSETPDDIGIPAVIADQIRDLICGYHLALIRPNKDKLDSIYLAKQLSTARVARHFAIHASGSTRYGLSISTIESVEIPTPPKREQTKIAEILSTVDLAIEQTEVLIAKQQRIKTGLMQDLLTRGIDEHGNLRSEQTHQFKDSPLGRIPVEWAIKRIGDVFEIQLGKMLSQKATEGRYPFYYLGNKNVQWDYVDTSGLQQMDFSERERSKFELVLGDILVCEGGEVGRTAIWRGDVESCYYQKAVHRLRPIDKQFLPDLFPRFMKWCINNGLLSDYTSQTSIAHLTQEKLAAVPIMVPTIPEQKKINDIFNQFDNELVNQTAKLNKLLALKTALMQDLLTGKKRVTPLLTEPQEASG